MKALLNKSNIKNLRVYKQDLYVIDPFGDDYDLLISNVDLDNAIANGKYFTVWIFTKNDINEIYDCEPNEVPTFGFENKLSKIFKTKNRDIDAVRADWENAECFDDISNKYIKL